MEQYHNRIQKYVLEPYEHERLVVIWFLLISTGFIRQRWRIWLRRYWRRIWMGFCTTLMMHHSSQRIWLDIYAKRPEVIFLHPHNISQVLQMARYKLIFQLVLGELKGQGLKITSKSLWDVEYDNYASYTYTNVIE